MLKKEENPIAMTDVERAKASVLVVETDPNERQNLRNALKTLGFGQFTDAPNHATALEKLRDRNCTHVIFDAKKSNMTAKEFLQKLFEMSPKVIAIPSSFEPNVDDVFDLLILGAKGYLVKPLTVDSLECAVSNATKGEPMSQAVLQARDRNEALVAIMMTSLDKVATILRQAEKFETAKREIPRALRGFKTSAELAKTFAKGGNEGLIEAMEKFCIERSKGPATRLGRLRQRLKTGRADEDQGGATQPATGEKDPPQA